TRGAFVSGEPGIGKTCLTAEFVGRSGAPLVLYGHCDPDFSVPYHPFVEALSAAARADSAWLASLTEPQRRQLARLLPVDLETPADPDDAFPDVERDVVFHATYEALAAVGRARPFILVLDDLHWSEPA